MALSVTAAGLAALAVTTAGPAAAASNPVLVWSKVAVDHGPPLPGSGGPITAISCPTTRFCAVAGQDARQDQRGGPV
jgi:hypothetical protein